METWIDCTECHAPPGGDPRIHGRKLREMGKYVGMAGILAAAIGFYFFYFQSRGHIKDLNWAIALGVTFTLVIGQLIQLLWLHKKLSIPLWMVVLFAGNVIHAGGLGESELGVVLLSVSGTLLLISATMIIKGNIRLKTYL